MKFFALSKTITGKKGLEFAEDNEVDVVSCVLPMVIGPFVCPFVPASVYLAASLFFATYIEDAVDTHIFLMENPDVKGRYMCRSIGLSAYDLADFLATAYPDFNIPITDKIKETKDYKGRSLSTKKLLDAGFKYRHGVKGMYSGLVKSGKERGFL
ncbi:hypothetical protein MLD38_038491 [Melastoma candidum]|uniref:Uncharacterized protein n=1 Tax=Melastoma candidum TaxID=119954 RepID=A0ACB9KZS8_9MYRT|nr:hypothetical protein MLD38_038491 [Melastoma candidum]